MLAAIGLGTAAIAAPPALPITPVAKVAASNGFRQAMATIDAEHDRTVEDIITLTEIPAPPFKEAARAAAYRDMFVKHGLKDVTIDQEGNVVGIRPGTKPGGPALVVSAHLDTVFPEGTDVTVRREGTKLMAPGVGDDTRSLAVLLAWMRAMDAAKVRTAADIIFVGTVGEEGTGDLRGVRHFFTASPHRARVGGFISVDGTAPDRVTNGGVGSKRYKVTYSGPGGHSFGAFGLVNPMSAMAKAINGLYEITPPTSPKTTYSASVIEGGTSVNSIPNAISAEFDLRSAGAAELAAIDKAFAAIVEAAAAAENRERSTSAGSIEAKMEVIGDRPAGETPADSPFVATVAAAVKSQGYTAELGSSSTDSNLPMSIGVPAVTIGSGGTGGRAHALDEYIDVEKGASVKGMGVGLAAILALAGMQGN